MRGMGWVVGEGVQRSRSAMQNSQAGLPPGPALIVHLLGLSADADGDPKDHSASL